MRKRYWIFTVFLISVIFGVEYDLARRIKYKNVAQQKKAVLPTILTPTPEVVTARKAPVVTSILDSRFIQDAQKISQLKASPKVIDEKFDRLAKSMDSFELKKLSLLIGDQNADSEQRAMAVELLARSKSAESMKILRDFVAADKTPVSATWNPNREYESVLRAQAIEGIATYPKKELALSYLNSLSDMVNESFLKDRISRSEESLKGRASAPIQDESVLKQLVQ